MKKNWLGLLVIVSAIGLFVEKPTLNLKANKEQISQTIRNPEVNFPEGNFYYAGDISSAALSTTGLYKKLSRIRSNFILSYQEPLSSPPGSTTGIQMLLDRRIDFAYSNRPLTKKEIAQAKSKGYRLEAIPIAIDGLSFFVNNNNNNSSLIRSLSIRQLQAIYQGKITNWQQVGGRNLPITPISLDPKVDSSLQLLYKTERDWDLTSKAIIVRDYTSAIRKASSIPGAIAYGSSAIIQKQNSIHPIAVAIDRNSPAISAVLSDNTINFKAFQMKVYPLTRHLFIVVRSNKNKQQINVGVAYANLLLSDKGQKIIQQAGFVPLDGNLRQN